MPTGCSGSCRCRRCDSCAAAAAECATVDIRLVLDDRPHPRDGSNLEQSWLDAAGTRGIDVPPLLDTATRLS